MFRKKKKEPVIEFCELWSLRHTLAKIISRYLKEFIEASSLSGSTPGSYYHKDPENCWSLWEVQRELTEILFHRLQDAGEKVYLKPSREVMQNYIDISQSGIIIKPLISGSPVTIESGIPMPTLEKIIVDTLCDEDFSYLQGGEWEYIVDNSFSMFDINSSRLFRYAGRRGKMQEIKEAVNSYLL